MSVQQVDDLHRRAKRHLENGELEEALGLWQELLIMDPDHEEAREGVTRVIRSAEAAGTPENAPVELLEPDGHTGIDPATQQDGIDLGDTEATNTIPLRNVEHAHDETVPDDPIAAGQLRQRVQALLAEARSHADSGSHEDALAVLARVFILDEDNAEAHELDDRLREASGAKGAEIEEMVGEAIQLFDAGRLVEAEDRFRAVLDRCPDHHEAKTYLEEIAERPTAHQPVPAAAAPAADDLDEGDFLGGGFLAPPPEADAAPEPQEIPVAPQESVTVPTPPLAGASSHEQAQADDSGVPGDASGFPGGFPGGDELPELEIDAAPARTRGVPIVPVAAVAGVIVVLLGFWMFSSLFSGGEEPEDVVVAGAAPIVAATNDTKAVPEPQAPALPPDEMARRVAEGLERGRSAARNGDYSAAVVAFNEVLEIDPEHEAAREELLAAGRNYREENSGQREVERIRLAFRDGEYASALRIAYRLPETVDPGVRENCIVNGWYNLGLVSLKARKCDEAMGHFDEALGVRSTDSGARKLRGLARNCRHGSLDAEVFALLEDVPFRGVE